MQTKNFLTSAVSAALLLGAALTPVASLVAVARAHTELETETPKPVPYETYVLDNGLQVILHQDRTLPLVAVNIWYHVGPANEPPGRSGFAHLFEHLMFEGSKHVGSQFDTLLESVGATNINGTTYWDRTNYFETVPSEHLELVLWLESDRMGFLLDAIDQQALDIQRDVVKNERRQSFENAPYGPSRLGLLNTLFPEGHPYHGAVIGSMKDLSAATLDDVKSFYRDFYAPSNATLTLAGSFDDKVTRTLIERYFGSLPDRAQSGGRKAPRAPTATPPLPSPKRLTVTEPVAIAKVSMAWITPPAYTPDDTLLDLATTVLGSGKTSRLYRKLVVERRVASEVEAYVDSNQLASTVVVSAFAETGRSPQELESEMSAVLDELSTSPPTHAELARAKRSTLLGLYSDLQLLNGRGGESGRAGTLQRFNHYLKNPGFLAEWIERIEHAAPKDVEGAVRRHLQPNARLVVVTEPEPAKPAETQSEAKP